jgi:translocation and assembly module TamB
VTPRTRTWPRKVVLLAVLLAAAAVALLQTRAAADGACGLLRRHLPEALGLEVGVGSCEVDPLTQEVRLRGLSLFRPGDTTPLLAADGAEVRLGSVRPLLGGVRLESVRLERPRLAVDLSRPAGPGAQAGTCPLDVLRKLEVGRLSVEGARVELALPGGGRVEVEGLEVGWRTRREGTELQLRAPRGTVRALAAGEVLPLHQLALEGVLSVEDGTLEVGRAEVALDEALLTVVGRVEELCSPALALDGQLYAPAASVGRALGWKVPLAGRAWTRFTATGPLAAPELRAELSAHGLEAGGYAPGDLTARLGLRGRTLTLESLGFRAGAGEVQVRGTVELARGLPARLTLETREASFARILERAGLRGAWVDFPATAQVGLAGTLLPAPQLQGTLALKSGRFQLAARPFDAPPAAGRTLLAFSEGSLEAGVRVLPDRVELSELKAASGRSRLRGAATLHYAAARGLDVQGAAELELRDFGAIAGLGWKGRGSARFSVRGPYSQVAAEADLALRDFEFWDFALGVVQGRLEYADGRLRLPGLSGQKGRTPFHGDVEVDFRGRDTTLALGLDIPQGRSEDVVDVLAPLHRAVAAFQGELTGRVEGAVRLSGPLSTFGGGVELRMADTRLRGRRLGDGAVRLRFEEGRFMVLDGARLEGPLGRTSAEGRWDLDAGTLDYRFRGEGLSLAELARPGQGAAGEGGAAPLEGVLALEGSVFGDTDVPAVSATLRSARVRAWGRDLGALSLEARLLGRELEVWGRPVRDAEGRLRAELAGDWPWSATLAVAVPEVRALLPEPVAAQGLSGTVQATLSARGEVYRPEALAVDATVDRLQVSRGELRGQAEGDVVLRYAGGRLEVQPFTFRGSGTELRGAGTLSEARVEGRLEGAVDLRLVESFLPGLEGTAGRLSLSAAARGSLARPVLVGTAELTDARTSLRDWPVTVRGLDGRVSFDDRSLKLEALSGLLNEGRLTAGGEVALAEGRVRQVALDAQLEGVGVRAAEDLPFTTSGHLSLAGPPSALALSGQLEVQRLRYARGLELDELLRSVGRARAAVVTRAEQPRDFLSLAVSVRLGDVRVENNLARLRLVGDLQLTGTNARPGLLGSVRVAEGGRAFFRGNQFSVTAGSLEFVDRYAFDPVVDVRAQSQVRTAAQDYVVALHAFGRAREPQVLLTADPTLPEGQILSLLTLGMLTGDVGVASAAGGEEGGPGAGTQMGLGLAAEALLSVSGLDRQVQRFLPTTPLLKDPDFKVSTLYNEVTNGAEPTVQLESTFLTEQLRLQISQPVVTGKGTRALLEYRLDDRVSVQGQWDNRDSTLGYGNPGLELKWKMEVE